MEIGNNEDEYMYEDGLDSPELGLDENESFDESNGFYTAESDDKGFLESLLLSRGIEDSSRIKFEDENGIEQEVSWENLSDDEKMNIINSTSYAPETELDNSEIDLINAIRSSLLSPEEYLGHVANSSISNYVNQSVQPLFRVDLYSDDELFLADFIARTGNVTDEEAQEALAKARSNNTLFAKQMQAIRNEYRVLENNIYAQYQAEQEAYAQAQYNQFASSVADQINNLTEIQGYDLNLEPGDKLELYDFVTGVDAAGNNHFAKALADPQTLIKTAYWALNGQQMISDITNYFLREITQVRKESYERGRKDALKNNNNVVFKSRPSYDYQNDGLDDF